MTAPVSRREALKQLGAAGAAVVLGARTIRGSAVDIVVAGEPVEIAVASLAPTTARVTIRPLQSGQPASVPATGELADQEAGKRAAPAATPG